MRTIDVQILKTSKQTKSGKHADEPKHMVSMQMRQEDGLQMRETESGTTQSHLCTLGAVEHK